MENGFTEQRYYLGAMITYDGLPLSLVLQVVWKRTALLGVVSAIAVLLYMWIGDQIIIPDTPIAIFGTVLAILLGFRVNNAYQRWWEARKLWGKIVNESRSCTRQLVSFIPDVSPEVQRQLVYRQVGYCYALRNHLRKLQLDDGVTPYFDSEEMKRHMKRANVPNSIMQQQSLHIAELTEAGALNHFQQLQLEDRFTTLIDCQGGCERIKNTVFPHDYRYYSTVFVNVFSFALPFVIVDTAGWQVIPWTIFLGFALGALDHLARAIEQPFEDRVNDTAMSAISRTIEIDLRQMIADAGIPEPATPKNGVLM